MGNPRRNFVTVRERSVLECLLQGLTDKEIASALGIAPTTASHHVHSLMFKLDEQNRTQLAVESLRQGIIALSSGPRS